MIDFTNNLNFKARMVFKVPNKTVKPYVLVDAKSNFCTKPQVTTKEPSWLTKFLFGLRKGTKLPSRKK